MTAGKSPSEIDIWILVAPLRYGDSSAGSYRNRAITKQVLVSKQ